MGNKEDIIAGFTAKLGHFQDLQFKSFGETKRCKVRYGHVTERHDNILAHPRMVMMIKLAKMIRLHSGKVPESFNKLRCIDDNHCDGVGKCGDEDLMKISGGFHDDDNMITDGGFHDDGGLVMMTMMLVMMFMMIMTLMTIIVMALANVVMRIL